MTGKREAGACEIRGIRVAQIVHADPLHMSADLAHGSPEAFQVRLLVVVTSARKQGGARRALACISAKQLAGRGGEGDAMEFLLFRCRGGFGPHAGLPRSN
jgi:hypothetical protein